MKLVSTIKFNIVSCEIKFSLLIIRKLHAAKISASRVHLLRGICIYIE